MKLKTINHKVIKTLMRIRNVEQAFLDLFGQGKLNGTVHTCIGQELSALAFAGQIKKSDFVFSNHRCHGHFIAYTREWKKLILELLGKEEGICGGVGSSQHLQHFNFYSNGIQGGIVPMAAGYALGNKLRKNNSIGVVYIGDGTLGEGIVYETLNFISKKDIPLIIVCENNQYAQSTPIGYNLAGSIEKRAEAFGIEVKKSNTFGENPSILDEAKESIEWVRANQKPLFHIVDTYRLKAHSKGDDDRDVNEIREYEKIDFLNILKNSDPEYFERENLKIKSEVDDFIEIALQKPEQNLKSYLGEDSVQSNRSDIEFHQFKSLNGRLVSKMNTSFHQLMNKDNVVFIGEDILDPYGGAFKISKGLSDNFPDRVIGTSISEGLIGGVSNGLALNGFKPFAEFMFGDFTALAFDQMLNHAAKIHNMYNKKVYCPVVFRTPMGGKRGYGPTHSQSLEKHFLGMDTFEILAVNRYLDPAKINDYAYQRKHPTLIIENKSEYGKSAKLDLPDGYEIVESNEELPSLLIRPKYDKASTTIVTYGGSCDIAISELERLFMDFDEVVQILILTQIDPIPKNLLTKVLENSKKVLFIEEGAEGGTVGDYFVSWIVQNLKIYQLGTVNSNRITIPSVKSLEDSVLVNSKALFNGIDNLTQ